MISDFLIRHEKLKLMLVVDVLDDEGVEVDGAFVYLLGERVNR